MTTPSNHQVAITNRYGNVITAPVVYVKDLGEGRADVHIETNYYIEIGYTNPATYTVPGNEARPGGTRRYTVNSNEFTERMNYIYRGIFERR